MRLRFALLSLAVLAMAPPGAGGADAQVSPAASDTAVSRYQRAAARFTQLAEAAGRRGTVPRRTDPEVAALLDLLSDYRAAFGEGESSFEDLFSLLEAATGAQSRYLNFGMTDPGVPRSNGQRDRNMAAFQDEAVPLVIFVTEGNGRLYALLADVLLERAAAPEARQQFLMLRQLARFGLWGPILMPTAEGLSPAHKLALLEAGARHADSFAQAMSLSDRQAVLARAREIRTQADPAYRAGLDRIIAALARQECVGLCAL